MSNYREENSSGEIISWRRAYEIRILAPFRQAPKAQFNEEDLTLLPDGRTMVTNNTSVECIFDNPERIINAVNRETGEVVGQFPIGLLDAMLTGIYLEEAQKRDSYVPPVIEQPTDNPINE